VEAVGGDVVVFQRPKAALKDENAAALAVVDAVVAQAWIGTAVNGDTCEGLAGDVAAFQLQATLGDVHAEPRARAADLAKGKVDDSTDVGLEHQRIEVMGLDLDVLDQAVAEDLQGLVYHHALSVQARPDQDAVTRLGRLDGRADSGEVSSLIGVNHMGRGLGLGRWPGWGRRLGRRSLKPSRPDRSPSGLARARWLGGGLLPEGVTHAAREMVQGFAHHRRGEGLIAKLPPVGVLPGGQHQSQLVSLPPSRVVQLRSADVVDGQHKIAAVELLLAS
jgi:hypothetical protein